MKRSQRSNSAVEEDGTPPEQHQAKVEGGMGNSFDQNQEHSQENNLGLATSHPQLVQPSPVLGTRANALNANSNQCKYRSHHDSVRWMLI